MAQDGIYRRHGIGESLDPARLTAPGIVSLAMDLQGETTETTSGRMLATVD